MNKRSLFVVIILCSALVVAVAYIFRPKHPTVYTPTTTKEPELGSNQPIALQQGDKLGTLLLKEQYLAVRDAIFEYTFAHYGTAVKAVEVSGEPVVQTNGDITLTIKIVGSDKQFAIVVSRPTFDTIVFSVPAASYAKTLDVYGGAAE